MKSKFFAALFLGIFLAASNAFAVVLPDPSGTFDGLPVAIQYDEFIVYSTQLLTQFGFAGFDGAAGVGGLDVVTLTQSGIDNDPVAGGFLFEDPAASETGNVHTFSGTWGAGDQPNGPVLVDTLLDYLHTSFGPTVNIPIFTFDMVEPGSDPDLQLVANFIVYDPDTNSEVDSWSFDIIPNTLFDPAAFVTVHNHEEFIGLSNTHYSFTNTGSGAYDFVSFAPTMNLANYAGQGYEFHIFSEFRNIDGGGEESFISGALQAPNPPPPPVHTPEPATFALFGMGLLGMGAKKLRSKKR